MSKTESSYSSRVLHQMMPKSDVLFLQISQDRSLSYPRIPFWSNCQEVCEDFISRSLQWLQCQTRDSWFDHWKLFLAHLQARMTSSLSSTVQALVLFTCEPRSNAFIWEEGSSISCIELSTSALSTYPLSSVVSEESIWRSPECLVLLVLIRKSSLVVLEYLKKFVPTCCCDQ